MINHLQKVSGNTENTGEDGGNTSLGGGTGVSDRGVGGSGILASSAVSIAVTTSADSSNDRHSRRSGDLCVGRSRSSGRGRRDNVGVSDGVVGVALASGADGSTGGLVGVLGGVAGGFGVGAGVLALGELSTALGVRSGAGGEGSGARLASPLAAVVVAGGGQSRAERAVSGAGNEAGGLDGCAGVLEVGELGVAGGDVCAGVEAVLVLGDGVEGDGVGSGVVAGVVLLGAGSNVGGAR